MKSGQLHRVANRMPAWLGSVRMRLTVLYSTVLFGLASSVVGGLYLALRRSLDDEPVTRTFRVAQFFATDDGSVLVVSEDQFQARLRDFESSVNERALDQLRDYSFWALALLFAASLIVGWFVAGRVLRPIGRITAVARDIQATDLSRRIEMQGPDDELRHLADTFDDMLDRIDTAFESQRRFIHEASHELRNPLAVMRANLDVALADPDADVEDFRRTARIVGHSTERMTRLVDDLLVWARQENQAMRSDPVDVGEVVRRVVSEFETPAAANGVTLRGGVEQGLWVVGDGAALGRAVANLLANAVRVSLSGTTITVRAGRQGNSIFIEVEDQGPGIDPSDHQAVFQRFYRGDQDQARAQGRSGLGLTIVRQIADAHGGTVTLDSAIGRGATFTIRIPGVAADEPTIPFKIEP